MSQQDFLKTVREKFETAQTSASKRFDHFNTDARKAFDEWVARSKESQRDISGRLQKSAEGVSRRVKQASGDSAAAMADQLRKAASRLDRLAHGKTVSPGASSPIP